MYSHIVSISVGVILISWLHGALVVSQGEVQSAVTEDYKAVSHVSKIYIEVPKVYKAWRAIQ